MSNSLLNRIALGDRTAVDDCVNKYGGLVWSIALKLLGDRSDAEDGAQEVFIDLWKYAGRFDRTVGSEAAFVATIARRRLIDRLRKRNRRPDHGPGEIDVVSNQPAADTQAEVREESDRVRESMKQLKDEERQVLELAILQSMPQHEIAGELNMPLGTVKSHARRGMKRLREIHQSSVKGATS